MVRPSAGYSARRLHVLGDVFSKVVEAVPEVARREEECRLVEDETEKSLSRLGGIDHLQVRTYVCSLGCVRVSRCFYSGCSGVRSGFVVAANS